MMENIKHSNHKSTDAQTHPKRLNCTANLREVIKVYNQQQQKTENKTLESPQHSFTHPRKCFALFI